jgi:hypothetical protein
MTIGYPQRHDIKIEINAPSDGQLAVKFPNNYVADYPYYDKEQKYASVFVDGVEIIPGTRTELCEEMYYIQFEKGAEEIEIVGSALPAALPISGKGHTVDASVLATPSKRFDIPMITNSDTCTLDFYKDEKRLEVSVSRPLQGDGYLQLTIPKEMLNGNFTVMIDGIDTEFNATGSTDLGNATIIEVNYPLGARTVEIIGTTAIPEFNPVHITLILASLSVAVLVHRYKQFERKFF